MTVRTESIRQGADEREGSAGAQAGSNRQGGTHQIPVSPRFCAVCFLVFGSQEKRVVKGGRVAHPTCASSLRGTDAA